MEYGRVVFDHFIPKPFGSDAACFLNGSLIVQEISVRKSWTNPSHWINTKEFDSETVRILGLPNHTLHIDE